MSKTVKRVSYSLREEDSKRLERLFARFSRFGASSESERFRSFLERLEEMFPFETNFDNTDSDAPEGHKRVRLRLKGF